jgi:hypothetical protein
MLDDAMLNDIVFDDIFCLRGGLIDTIRERSPTVARVNISSVAAARPRAAPTIPRRQKSEAALRLQRITARAT